MSKWLPIETADKQAESLDLFGWIPYDRTEMRLTDCEFINGEWHYFQDGQMLPVSNIDFTPTHWMPLPEDPQ